MEAEHDPVASRRASDAAIRQMLGPRIQRKVASATSPIGTSIVQRKEVGDTDEQERMDAAAQPVAMKVPEAKARGKSVPVATDRAPTVEEVFDPQRPALDGATNDVVMKRITHLVTVMYKEILDRELAALRTQLAKARPVPPTPFALKLLTWAAEQVVSGMFGYIGRFIGRELFADAPATETTVAITGTESEPVVMTTTKVGPTPPPNWKEQTAEKKVSTAGEKAGGQLKEKLLERPTAEPSKEDELPALTTGDLLEEFLTREHIMLHARQSDILTRLEMMQGKASKNDVASPEFVELAEKLRNLLESGALRSWFRTKVTMEWLNFMARVSLGPRAEGQTTDLVGANTIGGIAAAGAKARVQWLASDGMIEIQLAVPDTVHGTSGLALQRASIPSSYGAAEVLQRLRGTGTYNLATLPVYRRVWLQTGDSKLTETPAFVITPDGSIEADVDNPVLAAIGSQLPMYIGDSTYVVGGTRRGDEARWSANANATFSRAGAELVRNLLRGISPEVLR